MSLETIDKLSPLHRFIRTIAGWSLMKKVWAIMMHRIDRPIIHLTKGKHSATSILSGLPVVTLNTTGAKSGQPRSIVLVGIPDGKDVILIASNWGQTKHPAWYYNLQAYPETSLTYGGQTHTYTAHMITGAERDASWEKAIAVFGGYALYRQRANQREIGLFRLTPTAIKI